MQQQAIQSRRRVSRLTALGIFFLLCCVIYVAVFAGMELKRENIGGHAKDGTTERTVIVQAMRGQIYDRNGKPLVTNEYTYSLTVDYSVLPKDARSRNAILLKTLEVLYSCGEGGLLVDYRYPFLGVYPDVMYSSVSELPGSANYEATFSADGASYRITIKSYDPNRDEEAKEYLIQILEAFVF